MFQGFVKGLAGSLMEFKACIGDPRGSWRVFTSPSFLFVFKWVLGDHKDISWIRGRVLDGGDLCKGDFQGFFDLMSGLHKSLMMFLGVHQAKICYISSVISNIIL